MTDSLHPRMAAQLEAHLLRTRRTVLGARQVRILTALAAHEGRGMPPASTVEIAAIIGYPHTTTDVSGSLLSLAWRGLVAEADPMPAASPAHRQPRTWRLTDAGRQELARHGGQTMTAKRPCRAVLLEHDDDTGGARAQLFVGAGADTPTAVLHLPRGISHAEAIICIREHWPSVDHIVTADASAFGSRGAAGRTGRDAP